MPCERSSDYKKKCGDVRFLSGKSEKSKEGEIPQRCKTKTFSPHTAEGVTQRLGGSVPL